MKIIAGKNSIRIMIVLAVSMMLLAGCGDTSNIDKLSYEDITTTYSQLANSRQYLGEDVTEGEINIELVSALAESEDWNVYYALKDIDGDGVDELLLGGGFDTDEIVNYEIYTMQGENAVKLLEDYEFGSRVTFEVYEDGTIKVRGSSSAEETAYEYYKINGETASVELIGSEAAENDSKYIDGAEMAFEWIKL